MVKLSPIPLQLPLTGLFLKEFQIIGCKKRNIPPIIPVSRTTWVTGVISGKYPKPVKISERNNAWRVEDIRALIIQLGGEV